MFRVAVSVIVGGLSTWSAAAWWVPALGDGRRGASRGRGDAYPGSLDWAPGTPGCAPVGFLGGGLRRLRVPCPRRSRIRGVVGDGMRASVSERVVF